MYTETDFPVVMWAFVFTSDHTSFQIPVFRGAASCLVGATNPFKDHFGTDGLGDVLQDRDSDTWKTQIQKEHAVNSLIRLVNEHPGQVGKTNSN